MKLERVTLSGTEKISLVSNLQTLLSAGIPILEAVESLLEDSKGNSRRVLESLKKDLGEGKHIYVSLARFPRVFDKVTVNLIRASEEAGTLDVSLKDLKENIKRDLEFVDRIKAALTYPAIIMLVFIGVLVMILTVVVPKISVVFSRLRVELPLPTKILIAVSNFMVHNTLVFILGLIAVVGLVVLLFVTNKRFMLQALFMLPLVSKLIKQIELTRFSRNLALLLTSGLPITSALELSQDVLNTKELRRAITKAREMVAAGKRFSEGLRSTKKAFPTMMIKIIEAGEKTGRLDVSMQEVAANLDYEVTNNLKLITALLEPIMLVLVGVGVGGMMLAIIAPIYGLIGQVGAR